MSVVDGKKVKLFTLNANRKLAEDVSQSAGIALSEVEVSRFADGEINISIKESVRGHNVFVIQPTSSPVNENLMELLIMADALKRASARSVTVLMPYYGYSRQDRKSQSRQPITAKLVADLLQTAGIDRIICIDLHAAQIQGFFDVPIDNFPASPLLADYFLHEKKLKDVVVVSPDHGGATRARVFAKILEAPMAIIDKRRPEANKALVMNIIGSVEGKNCIMIDDMIDTAGTLTAGAEALMAAGAKSVYAAATHAIFSGEAINRIQNSKLCEVVVTDTIQINESKKIDKIKQISIGHVLGQAVLHVIKDESISEIFDRIGSSND